MTVLDRSAIEAALRGPLGDTFNPDGPVYGTLLPRLTEALLKAQEEATQERDALAKLVATLEIVMVRVCTRINPSLRLLAEDSIAIGRAALAARERKEGTL